MDNIRLRGARTHNLKNIDLTLPRDQLIVITGVSGCGKSSLAFDTIYAEGQRRYVESLSAYARQFLSVMEKPDIDHIEGLSPAISIEQKSTSHNPRSTVGTITEIYDYLRLLFARAGTPRCPDHGHALEAQTVSQMVDAAMAMRSDARWMLLAPVVVDRKGEHAGVFEQLLAQGYTRVRVDGELYDTDQVPPLALRQKHTIEAVVDRFRTGQDEDALRTRLAESFEAALKLGDGMCAVERLPDVDSRATKATKSKGKGKNSDEALLFSSRFACPVCGYSLAELEPRLFSFNAPVGACPTCDGLGVAPYIDPRRVVRNEALTLAQGAVVGWGKANPGMHARLMSVGRALGFGMDVPWQQLPAKHRKAILEGTTQPITIHYQSGYVARKPFEGVLGYLERHRAQAGPEGQEAFSEFISERPCVECGGARLNLAARHVFVDGRSLPSLVALPVREARTYFEHLRLAGWRGEIAAKIVKEINERLRFLSDVGLDYLTLDRRADTLSGGEAQRIRLASQIGAGLVGVMYVLDEPSIGLHQRDNARLLATLTRLRDLGNTVIVVEHDEDAIHAADHLVDIGPLAGLGGGDVVAQGSVKDLMDSPRSLTGDYLAGRRKIEVPKTRMPFDPDRTLCVSGASGNNLHDVTAEIPVGLFTCVTGVSGSGKSTLINDTLRAWAARELNGASVLGAPCRGVEGLNHLDKVVDIDQSPIGRTPRSNPATYTGVFTPLRELFAQTPEARARGYTPGRFSFNVRGGRCEACQGDGLIKVEMHFLPDVYVPCDTCGGKRYNRETLDVQYKGYNIHQVLDMTVEQALGVFEAIPAVARKLDTLVRVGLGYIRLGQSATTLSGGEAQRVKLAKELSRRDTGNTLYILDEPTTGLHFYDIEHLLGILSQLRDAGNTVVVIEHNLDVIKTADWIIDLGPEGGEGGGQIVATGTPEQVAQVKGSYTGQYLAPLLTSTSKATRKQTSKGRGKQVNTQERANTPKGRVGANAKAPANKKNGKTATGNGRQKAADSPPRPTRGKTGQGVRTKA